MPRWTKRTPEVEQRILHALRLGSTHRLAAAAAGIDHSTLYRWTEADPAWALQIKEAEGQAVVGWLKKIEEAAAGGNWQAAAWKLERRYPQDFGRPQPSDRLRIEADAAKSPVGASSGAVFTLRIDRGDEDGG